MPGSPSASAEGGAVSARQANSAKSTGARIGVRFRRTSQIPSHSFGRRIESGYKRWRRSLGTPPPNCEFLSWSLMSPYWGQDLNLRPPGYETRGSKSSEVRFACLSPLRARSIMLDQVRWVQNGCKFPVSSDNAASPDSLHHAADGPRPRPCIRTSHRNETAPPTVVRFWLSKPGSG